MPPSSPRFSSLARAASRARRRSASCEEREPPFELGPALSPMEKRERFRREPASPVVPGGASLPARPLDRRSWLSTTLDMAWYEKRSLFAFAIGAAVAARPLFNPPAKKKGEKGGLLSMSYMYVPA